MKLAIDELARAIYRFGREVLLVREIQQDVVERLAAVGVVHLEVDSASERTPTELLAVDARDVAPKFDGTVH